jgi:hypothetical protein
MPLAIGGKPATPATPLENAKPAMPAVFASHVGQNPVAHTAKEHGVDALYASIMEGDLGKMSKEQRLLYYKEFCERLGLNPLSKPFGFYEMQKGKITMYALKEATNQLARRDNVSVEILKIDVIKEQNFMEVHVRARSKEWKYNSQAYEERVTDEIGAIAFSPELKGDMAANQRMKCITKAKRRAILSHCGLGVIDETEVETLKARVISAEEFIEGVKVEAKTEPKPEPKPEPKAEASSGQKIDEDAAEAEVVVEAKEVTIPQDHGDMFNCTVPAHMDWLVHTIKSGFPKATRALVVPLAECLKSNTSRLAIINELGELQKQPEEEVTGYVARKKK